MINDWNLERKPTTAERMIGVLGSVLLCVVGAVSFWFSFVVWNNSWATLFTGGFTVLSAVFLIRFIFTDGQKLGRQGILILASVITVVGFIMLILSVVLHDLHNRFMFISLGLSGLSAGILSLIRLKKSS